jgi:hypothetical protein
MHSDRVLYLDRQLDHESGDECFLFELADSDDPTERMAFWISTENAQQIIDYMEGKVNVTE